MSDDIEHIRVWHRTWADCDKSELDALRAENARLRQLVISAANRMNRSAAIIMRDLDDPRILRASLAELTGGENE